MITPYMGLAYFVMTIVFAITLYVFYIWKEAAEYTPKGILAPLDEHNGLLYTLMSTMWLLIWPAAPAFAVLWVIWKALAKVNSYIIELAKSGIKNREANKIRKEYEKEHKPEYGESSYRAAPQVKS